MKSKQLQNIIWINALDKIVIIALGVKISPAAIATLAKAFMANNVILANLLLQAIAFFGVTRKFRIF